MNADNLKKLLGSVLIPVGVTLGATLAPALAFAEQPVIGFFTQVEGPVSVLAGGERVRDAVIGQGIAADEEVSVGKGGYVKIIVTGSGTAQKTVELLPDEKWPKQKPSPDQVSSFFEFTKKVGMGGKQRGGADAAGWGLPTWTMLSTPNLELDWRRLSGGDGLVGEAILRDVSGRIVGRSTGQSQARLPETGEIAPREPHFWDLRLKDGRVYHGALVRPALEELKAIQAEFNDAPATSPENVLVAENYRAAVLIHHQLYREAAHRLGTRFQRDPTDLVADAWLFWVYTAIGALPPPIMAGIVENLELLANRSGHDPVIQLVGRLPDGTAWPPDAADGVESKAVGAGATPSYEVINLIKDPLDVFVFRVDSRGAHLIHSRTGATGALPAEQKMGSTLGPFCQTGGRERLVVVAQRSVSRKSANLEMLLLPPNYGEPTARRDPAADRHLDLLLETRFPGRFESLTAEERNLLDGIDAQSLEWICTG